MDKKERWELMWVAFVIVLFAIVIVGTLPLDFQVGGVPNVLSALNGVPSSDVVNVHITSYQYLFKVQESGPVNSNMMGSPFYYNVIVGHPGEYLNISMTSADVTSNFYFADYSDRVVTDQIVPGLVAYDVLPVPNITGVYAFLGGEYNGPWFSYQTGLLIDIPSSGYIPVSDLSQYISQTHTSQTSALVGDPYNPPIVVQDNTLTPSFYLQGSKEAVFNDSIPGPTLVVENGANVTISMYIPAIASELDYLYNYTSTGTGYFVDNVTVGIYAVWWNGTITPVAMEPISYNTTMTFHFTANAPAYLYGIVTPVYYNYNPLDLSSKIGPLIGVQKGYVMGYWGSVLVVS